MSFTLKINDVDRSSKLSQKKSLAVRKIVTDEVDEISFRLKLTASEMSTIKPESLQIVELLDGATTIFKGTIVHIIDIALSPDIFEVDIIAYDFSHVFTSLLAIDSFENVSLLYVINSLLNSYPNESSSLIDPMQVGWTGGTLFTDDYVEGTGAWKITDAGTISKAISKNLTLLDDGSDSDTSDYIDFFVRIDQDIDEGLVPIAFQYEPAASTGNTYGNAKYAIQAPTITIKMGDSGLTNYFSFEINSDFKRGWKYYHLIKSGFSSVGSPDWASIEKVEITTTGGFDSIWDDIRLVSKDHYTKHNINTGEFQVEYIAWNRMPLNRAFKDLGSLSGSIWFVDSDKDVNFYPREESISPFNITESNGKMVKNSLIVSEKADQIRNEIYVAGSSYPSESDTVEEFKGDGERTSFYSRNEFRNMAVRVDTGAGYVSKNVGIEFEDVDDGSFDWFANETEKYVRQATFGLPTVLSTTDKIEMTYNEMTPVLVVRTDPVSIKRYGRRQYQIIDKTIESLDGARQRALAELETYKDTLSDGDFITNVAGLEAGQYINITDANRNLNQDYLIRSIRCKIRTNDKLQYKVEIISKAKVTLIETLIRLLVNNERVIKVTSDTTLSKIITHLEEVFIAEAHTETLNAFVQKTYAPDVNKGKYGLCTYKKAIGFPYTFPLTLS